ncbi:amidase signature enzyme [Ramaria rubella]|nr:amidase signature enzyme [Ramaria rubella]
MSGIKIFMKVIIDAKSWLKDALMVRKPWDQQSYELVEHGNGKKLVFTIMWNDELVIPHPPIHRALEMTRDALIATGHKPFRHEELLSVARSICMAGGTEEFETIAALTGEPILSTMSLHQNNPPHPDFPPAPLTTVNVTDTGRPVDAIISPVAPFTAPPHGKYMTANYSMIWNSLDYPALAFPVTAVDPVLDPPNAAHSFLSEKDKANYELYKPEIYKDAPVGLQVVGRTQEEEAVIRMGEIIDK